MAMQQIHSPEWEEGLLVTGTFQAQSPSIRMARNGQDYLVFRIAMGGASVPVFGWPNKCEGPFNLMHGERIHLVGYSERYQDRNQVQARRIAPTHSRLSREVAWDRIRLIYQWLHPPVLQEFLESVLLDESLGRRFASLPASQRHHHAYPGGLLEHSVEVAWQIFWQSAESCTEESLATVAALLHDIGKLQTYREDGGYTAVSQQLGHDALTLEVLAPALGLLDEKWPEGGSTLRSLLVEEHSNPEGPGRAWKRAIRDADRESANLNQRNPYKRADMF